MAIAAVPATSTIAAYLVDERRLCDDLCEGVRDVDEPLVPHGTSFVNIVFVPVAEAGKQVEPSLKVESHSERVPGAHGQKLLYCGEHHFA